MCHAMLFYRRTVCCRCTTLSELKLCIVLSELTEPATCMSTEQQFYSWLTGALSLLKMKMSWSVDLVMMSSRPRRYSCRLQQIKRTYNTQVWIIVPPLREACLGR